MNKPVQLLIALMVMASGLFLLGSSTSREASVHNTDNTCIDCHSDEKFFIQNQKVYRYYQDWLDSPHRHAELVCNDCHGGNPTGKTKEQAHSGIYPASHSFSRVYYKKQPETCGECHENQAQQFSTSEHFKGLMGEDNAPTCSTCHHTMNRRPYFTTIVESTCEVCHYEGNKDKLPMVGFKVNQILRRLNNAKGYLNWTRLYFRDQNWPGDSRQEVKALEDMYHQILAAGHSFDLSVPDEASVELLTKLKRIYRKVENDEYDEPVDSTQ